jgi:chromosome segregation protein
MVGFKTFADRTELEFGPGITAIVGPNGSGKSNITDALRFCLGEGSVRTLRGNRMEEMIFAGSGTRQPAGMAECTVVFDNSDGYFPLDFGEISITRRLFRGGDTEYLINKSPSRLKDIHALLAGTGLGQGSICMLGGREMGMVLSPDAQDRKIVIEEASGVLKYKMRKREASRKLDQVKENLTRLHDIMREVQTGLDTAEHQVERYQRYKRSEERLRRLEVGLAAREMENIRKALGEVLQRGEAAAERAQKTGERMAWLEEQVGSRREEMTRLEDGLQQVQEERRHAAVELERARKDIALAEERAQNVERERERISVRLGRIQEQDLELGAQLSGAREEEAGAAARVAAREAEVLAQEAKIDALEQESVEKSPEFGEALREESAVAQERASVGARLQGAGDKARAAEERALALSEQAERVEAEGRAHGSRHEEKAAEAEELKARLDALDKESAELREQRAALEKLIEQGARDNEKIEDAYHQRSSRLGALMEIEDDYQGFSEGVRFLLRRPDKPAGVIGVVSECMIPERQHARAIEAALGGHAQDVLVESKRHAKACIELLKRERGGKVTFWPLDLDRPPQRRPDCLGERGVVGWAPDLVRYDARYEGVVSALLGRTVIVETLDHATELYEGLVRRRAFIPLIVTLDGDVLAPGGSMSGGAHKNTKAGPVQRRAELEALEKEVEELRKRFTRVREDRRRQDQELRDLRVRIDDMRAESQRMAARLAELDRAASVAQSRAESVGAEVARLQAQATEAGAEAASARKDERSLSEQLTRLDGRAAVVAEKLSRFAEERTRHEAARSALTRVLEDLREARAEAMRAASEAAQRVRFITERRAELAQEATDLQRDLSGQGGLSGTLEEQREAAALEVQRYSALESDLGARVEALVRERVAIGRTLEEMETELGAVSKEHEADRAELHGCEVERAHYQATYEEHRTRLEELEVTSQELRMAAEDIIDVSNGPAEIQRLRNYIKNFGAVNLGAMEDYERLKERHETMSTQIADLEAASASLKDVMAEMDQASTRQFAETFKKVRTYFTELFTELFNGGQADLILTRPEDLLDTGVDIMAQPPGKRLQNLSLLSSGEKALTAIAFLLSLLKARPSPFVVLDELDAPLDDTNVERVARKFEEFSENTQFITITHNRKTMEYARVLYGVTAGEPGVSRLVAVSLEEAQREAHPTQPPTEEEEAAVPR